MGWKPEDLPEKYQTQIRQQLGETPKKSKYKAQKTEYNGRRYDSKKEACYAADLDLRKQAGEILFWLEQVPFHLPGNVKYRCDFQVFYTDGSVEYVDVKGFETPMFKMKKKQVEALFPVHIKVV